MSESRSAKLVVVFIIAVVAFGFGSIAAVSTGGIFGLDLLGFYNNSSEDNSTNPFSLEMTNDSSEYYDSSNNSQCSNDKKTDQNSNSSSNNNDNSHNGNNNGNSGNDNHDNNDNDQGSDGQSETKFTKN
ncbi:hypothetical protein ALNOE001_13430 [Candidatus Methanobinarius endosymbioticus]|uniref:Uncharacterized protein n=1 Tax=Candidatus Methanobinarius endosymbioticus TaxID=2006182 RepID=A0A366MB67_9EURY|nr:hypothetical protein ALNOE001_13430 [Candidatus Methanobinarius endosymbioticus]